ncbi:MAG: glycosyltransferase family 4 protein [bacterium]
MRILEMCSVQWYNADAAYAFGFAQSMINRGHEVFFLSFPGSPGIQKASQAHMKIVNGINFKTFNPFRLLLSFIRFIRFIKESNIEIINAHRSEDHFFAGIAVRFITPHIRLLRTRGDRRFIKNSRINKILYEKWTYRHIAASNLLLVRGYYNWLDIKQDRLFVVYPGIADIGKEISRKQAREKLRIPADIKMILFIGRFDAVKGLDYLVSACHAVHKEIGAHLYILGRDEAITREDITAFHGYNDSWVTVINKSTDTALYSAAADIGVIASIGSEVIARVCIEFMCCSLPVVATKVGVLPEIVEHGKTGMLVSPKDSLEMSEAIISMLGNKNSLEAMARNARDYYEKFYTLECVGQKLESIYSE